MMKATLDARSTPTCGAFHRAVKEALGFPDWYGGNLDALYDCLTDLPAGTELEITHFEALSEHLGAAYAGRIRRVLCDAAAAGRFSWTEA